MLAFGFTVSDDKLGQRANDSSDPTKSEWAMRERSRRLRHNGHFLFLKNFNELVYWYDNGLKIRFF
jgi:hypothetical protein